MRASIPSCISKSVNQSVKKVGMIDLSTLGYVWSKIFVGGLSKCVIEYDKQIEEKNKLFQ